jgi:hypothetical protein
MYCIIMNTGGFEAVREIGGSTSRQETNSVYRVREVAQSFSSKMCVCMCTCVHMYMRIYYTSKTCIYVYMGTYVYAYIIHV